MIDFGEKLGNKILKLLEDIRGYSLLNKIDKSGKESFLYSIFPEEIYVGNNKDRIKAMIVIEERKMIIDKLVGMGIFEAKVDKDAIDDYESSYIIKINRDKFGEILDTLRKQQSIIRPNKGNKTIIYFNNDGDFWIDSDKKLCYSIKKGSKRQKILTYLIDNKDFQPVREIHVHVGGKDTQSVRSEIGKIRLKIKKFIQIEGKDIIQSSPNNAGYRINPEYIIKKV